MLGVMSWVSVCLLIAGLSPDVHTPTSGLFVISGLLGLISAVGLAHVARSEARASQKLYLAYVSEARTDALTELANRRAFEDEILSQISLAESEQRDLSMLFVDVDRFKLLNDGFGHQAGDFMLRLVAGLLRDTVREDDFVARFGGEEFAIVLPSTRRDEAIRVAEKIRNVIRRSSAHFRDDVLAVTVSIGIAQWNAGEDVQSLVERADKALYAAKKNGRDCSCQHNNESCEVIAKPPVQLLADADDPSHNPVPSGGSPVAVASDTPASADQHADSL
jgi:diguanylate cyclase (GGDEF)-like protein